jgi:hypothetical protein
MMMIVVPAADKGVWHNNHHHTPLSSAGTTITITLPYLLLDNNHHHPLLSSAGTTITITLIRECYGDCCASRR